MEAIPPTVTVAMPVWRYSDAHLAEVIESVRQQTLQGFEFIMVVDGPSTPLLDAIVDDLRERPLGVATIVHRLPENTGTANAINVAFEHPDSLALRYMTWLSADNVLNPSCLQTLADFLDANPVADAVYAQYIRDTGEMVAGHWHSTKRVVVNNPYRPLVDDPNCFIGPAFMWRRSLYEKVGAQRGATAHDYDYWLRIEEHGEIAWLPRALITYRVHSTRATHVKTNGYDAPEWQAAAKLRRTGRA